MSLYQKASLVQIPSGYKAADAKLYSVVPNSGDGDFTIDSDADATRVNKDGLIETTVANQARLNYDPTNPQDPHLLLEPTRTNLITRSYEFGTIWAKGGSTTVTTDFSTAPDGTNTASRLQMPSGFGTYLSIAASMSSGTSYSLTFYIKNNGGQALDFGVWQLSSGGTKTDSLLVTPTDEWVRYELNFTADSNSNYVFLDNNNNSNSVDCLIWGAQLEAGSYPTSYIPTSGSQVTRTKDTCINGGDDALFNDSEGVLFLDVEIPNNSSEVKQTSLNNGTTNEAVKILQLNGTTFRFEVVMSSGTNFSQDITVSPYQRNKLALQYKANEYKVFVNGVKQSVTQRSTLPTGLDRFNFNRGFSTTDDFTGKIYQAIYFNTALTDAELTTLTT
jgi:hypothetical protein